MIYQQHSAAETVFLTSVEAATALALLSYFFSSAAAAMAPAMTADVATTITDVTASGLSSSSYSAAAVDATETTVDAAANKAGCMHR